MQSTRRSNGIYLWEKPRGVSYGLDRQTALETALAELQATKPEAEVEQWGWSDRIYTINRPSPVITTDMPQLLLTIYGGGAIESDGLSDRLECGFRVYVPGGVRYQLFGHVLQGMNFRILTQPLLLCS